MSAATSDDVIGAHYALYKFKGSTLTGVDLTFEDFSDTNRWDKITVDFLTDVNRAVAQNISIRKDQTVLVQYSADEFGRGNPQLADAAVPTTTSHRRGARWLGNQRGARSLRR